MKIFVTGGTGSLGVYIIKYLRKAGYTDLYVISRNEELPIYIQEDADIITLVTGDIGNKYPLFDAIKDMDVVIHAAAEVSFDDRDSDAMLTSNIQGTTNVVNACLHHNVKKLIHVSSVAAIGRADNKALFTEETEWTVSEHNSKYGVTKYAAEMEVWRGYAEGLNVSVVNPSIILGAGDWDKGSFKMFSQIKKGVPFYPKGSTAIVDVRDVARFIVKLISKDYNGERFILAGANVTFRDLFQKMSIALGSKPPKKPLASWLGNIFVKLERLRSLITGSTPIITKESLVAAAHHSEYDNSKSRKVNNFTYTTLDDTINESAGIFLSGEKRLLEIK